MKSQSDTEDMEEIQEKLVVEEIVENDRESQDNMCIQDDQDTHIVDNQNIEDNNNREEEDAVVEVVEEEKLRNNDEEILESINVSCRLRQRRDRLGDHINRYKNEHQYLSASTQVKGKYEKEKYVEIKMNDIFRKVVGITMTQLSRTEQNMRKYL